MSKLYKLQLIVRPISGFPVFGSLPFGWAETQRALSLDQIPAGNFAPTFLWKSWLVVKVASSAEDFERPARVDCLPCAW